MWIRTGINRDKRVQALCVCVWKGREEDKVQMTRGYYVKCMCHNTVKRTGMCVKEVWSVIGKLTQ